MKCVFSWCLRLKPNCIKMVLITMKLLALLIVLNSGMERMAEAEPQNRKIEMTMGRTRTEFYGRWIELIYTEAFRRLDMELVIIEYPVERGNVMVEKGRVDGDLARSPNYQKAYPNLVQVEESPFSARYAAFAADPEIKVDGWESFRDTPYRVEYSRGDKTALEFLRPLVKPHNLSVGIHWTHSIRKLMAGRIDIYVNVEGSVLQTLAGEKFKDANIHIAGIVAEYPMNAYLLPKHAELAPKLSAVLKEMQEEELIERYQKMAMEETGGARAPGAPF